MKGGKEKAPDLLDEDFEAHNLVSQTVLLMLIFLWRNMKRTCLFTLRSSLTEILWWGVKTSRDSVSLGDLQVKKMLKQVIGLSSSQSYKRNLVSNDALLQMDEITVLLSYKLKKKTIWEFKTICRLLFLRTNFPLKD